jgi:hypothetical protein
MDTIIIQKTCLNCGKVLKGRSDKKYCNDHCRNLYNNNCRKEEDHLKTINRVLKKNRVILKSLLSRDRKSCRTTKDHLDFLQFHFCFYTHSQTNKFGQTFHFCYEYGYLTLALDQIVVIKRAAHLQLLNSVFQYR